MSLESCRLAAESQANAARMKTVQEASLESSSRSGLRPSVPPVRQQRPSLIDDLVLEYASPRTQQLLKEYEAQNQACSA